MASSSAARRASREVRRVGEAANARSAMPVTRWLDGRAAESVRTPRQAQPPSACRFASRKRKPRSTRASVVVAGAAERRQRPAVEVQRDRLARAPRASRRAPDRRCRRRWPATTAAARRRARRPDAPCRRPNSARRLERAHRGHGARELRRPERLLRRLGREGAVLLLLAQERLHLRIGQHLVGAGRLVVVDEIAAHARHQRRAPSRSRIGTGSARGARASPTGNRGGAPAGGAGVRRFITPEGYRKNPTCEARERSFFKRFRASAPGDVRRCPKLGVRCTRPLPSNTLPRSTVTSAHEQSPNAPRSSRLFWRS